MESGQESKPGWYEFPGPKQGYRYFDGTDWTDNYAPPAHIMHPKPASLADRVAGTMLGAILAWFVILLGANIAPDSIYFPVKFVVDESPSEQIEDVLGP